MKIITSNRVMVIADPNLSYSNAGGRRGGGRRSGHRRGGYRRGGGGYRWNGVYWIGPDELCYEKNWLGQYVLANCNAMSKVEFGV